MHNSLLFYDVWHFIATGGKFGAHCMNNTYSQAWNTEFQQRSKRPENNEPPSELWPWFSKCQHVYTLFFTFSIISLSQHKLLNRGLTLNNLQNPWITPPKLQVRTNVSALLSDLSDWCMNNYHHPNGPRHFLIPRNLHSHLLSESECICVLYHLYHA